MTENPSPNLRFDVPHTARIYDYLLDGKTNYAADRDAAEQIEKGMPDVRRLARTNRAFMQRATRFLIEQGIRQFLDIGTGIPTEPNLHQVAQQIAPEARVVYVDNDPIVLAHARALLVSAPEGQTKYIQADVTTPDAILDAPALRNTLDLTAPVALSAIALMHFVPGELAFDVIQSLTGPLAPGSFLVMSHFTADMDPEAVAKTVHAYREGGIAIEPRSRTDIARFFDGMDLVDPGIVPLHRWRPDGIAAPQSYDARLPGLGAVGRKVG